MTLLALCCSAKINVASPLTINLKPWQTMPRKKNLTTTKTRNQRGGERKGMSSFPFMGNFSEIFQKEKRVDLDKNKNEIQTSKTRLTKKSPSKYTPNEKLKQFLLDMLSKKYHKVVYIFMAIKAYLKVRGPSYQSGLCSEERCPIPEKHSRK